MKPAAFDYLAATSVEEAVSALASHGGDAKIIAGGQSLVPMLNFRLVRPAVLVDINRIAGLDRIEVRDGALHVGALTRHHALETSALVASHLPIVTAAMQHVAHLAIRNRGTIGGSISHADPAAELPMLALLLGARITLRGSSASRTVAAENFFVGTLATALAEDEMVTLVEFPLPPRATGWAFEEVARRKGDFALAAVGITMQAAGGKAQNVRIAMMGVGETAVRVREAENLMQGRELTQSLIEAAVAAAQAAVEPNTDLHASSDYRRFLVGGLLQKGLRAAWERANGAST